MGAFDNPAMAGLGSQQPIMGAPSAMAGYNPLGTGNPQMDAMFAQFAMPALSAFMGGQFIPQQFPAQNVMDQMVASKYMQASRMAEHTARQRGTDLMFQQFQGIRRRFDDKPLSPMGARQLNNFAGTVNSEFGMMMAEMVMGPQNTEDFFFGRRGDPVQLQRAVNQIGFYRPDAVTGADQMSGETLQEFSNQIYSNLYGPDADLNDISGLSAGRTGTMMSDLARRGLLPQSMAKMSSRQRAREMGYDAASNKFADPAVNKVMGEVSPEIRQAFAANSPLAEIEKLDGGGAAIRKIDATRVSNALKGYSEAVKSVRQIFGDNGMSNAPMGQLMAAMEALTQNSMSSMSPGKIENLMRRTQMASRDSGISLEALMGLSARSGALAQQYGLAPEIAANSVVSAMEHGRALRDTGGMTPGFGRMDADKSVLFATDANLRGAKSTVGRYLGALSRYIEENPDQKDSNTAKMLQAIRNGETTYFDGNKTVNIAEELGQRPDAFIRQHSDAVGMSLSHLNAAAKAPGSQEFNVSGLEMARQAAEYKRKIGMDFAGRGGIRSRATKQGMSTQQAAMLEKAIATGYGRAMIDDVDTTMTPKERIDALYSAMHGSLVDYAKSQGKDGQAAVDEADRLMTGENGLFKNEAEARAYLSEQYARTDTFTSRNFRLTTAELQQQYNSRTQTEAAARSSRNNIRAGIKVKVGDGSNFLQRFSDALADTKGKSFFEAVLGSVDSATLENQLMEGLTNDRSAVEADFEAMNTEYNAATVTSDADKAALTKSALGSAAGFIAFARQAEQSGYAGFVDKTHVSDATLKARINAVATNTATRRGLADVYRNAVGGSLADAERIFADPNSKEAQAAINELVTSGKLRQAGAEKIGLINDKEVTGAEVSAFINDQGTRLYRAGITDADRKRVEAIGVFGQQLDEGRVSGNALLARYGIENKELGEKLSSFIGGEGNETVLTDALKGVQGADRIGVMARFSRNVNAMGGFSRMGAAGFADRARASGRMTALESAADQGLITGDLAEAVKAKKDKRPLTEAQKKAYDAAMTGTQEEFKAQVEGAVDKQNEKVEDRTKTTNEILQQAASEEQAINKAAGVGGGESMVGQITSGIAAAMSNVFKDVKIENVTITNFKLPEGFGKELASGAVTAIASLATGGNAPTTAADAVTSAKDGIKAVAQSMSLTGTVKLDGLDKLIMQLQGDTSAADVPNGPPVAAA